MSMCKTAHISMHTSLFKFIQQHKHLTLDFTETIASIERSEDHHFSFTLDSYVIHYHIHNRIFIQKIKLIPLLSSWNRMDYCYDGWMRFFRLQNLS